MLAAYLLQTARLLQNPAAPVTLYSQADLTSFINTGRRQLAGESGCIPVQGALALAAGTRIYPFAAIDISGGPAGTLGPLAIRQAMIGVGSGLAWLIPRSFTYFNFYKLNNPAPVPGPPTEYAQFGQGFGGTLYVDPVPDLAYALTLNAICLPVPLVDDTTPEAIPDLWTDAVPFYGAYYGYLSAQRQADADKMKERYTEFADRARRFATSEVLPFQNPQTSDPTDAMKLGGGGQRGG